MSQTLLDSSLHVANFRTERSEVCFWLPWLESGVGRPQKRNVVPPTEASIHQPAGAPCCNSAGECGGEQQLSLPMPGIFSHVHRASSNSSTHDRSSSPGWVQLANLCPQSLVNLALDSRLESGPSPVSPAVATRHLRSCWRPEFWWTSTKAWGRRFSCPTSGSALTILIQTGNS